MQPIIDCELAYPWQGVWGDHSAVSGSFIIGDSLQSLTQPIIFFVFFDIASRNDDIRIRKNQFSTHADDWIAQQEVGICQTRTGTFELANLICATVALLSMHLTCELSKMNNEDAPMLFLRFAKVP